MKKFDQIFQFISARDIVLSVIGLLVGGLISWVISAHFYKRAIEDSQIAAEKATNEFNLLARGIESFGTVNYVRDDAGNVISIKIELSGHAQGNVTATGTLSDAP